MDFFLPDLQVSMVVTTPYTTLPGITPNKKYVIVDIDRDEILLMNDLGRVRTYQAINFIEADVFFALCLYVTFVRMLGLTNKPWN